MTNYFENGKVAQIENQAIGRLKGCLDWHKTEWYHSVFMTHNPKFVGPTGKKLFGLFFEWCFHHLKLKNLSLSDEN